MILFRPDLCAARSMEKTRTQDQLFIHLLHTAIEGQVHRVLLSKIGGFELLSDQLGS